MKRIVFWLDRHFENVIMCCLLSVIVCVLLAQIFCRYVLHSTIPWAEELARTCFMYSAMFALPFSIRRNRMLRVDFILNFFSERGQEILFIVGDAIALVLWIYLWRYSWNVLADSLTTVTYSTTMPFFAKYWLYGMPVLTYFLSIVRQIQMIVIGISHCRKAGVTEA